MKWRKAICLIDNSNGHKRTYWIDKRVEDLCKTLNKDIEYIKKEQIRDENLHNWNYK